MNFWIFREQPEPFGIPGGEALGLCSSNNPELLLLSPGSEMNPWGGSNSAFWGAVSQQRILWGQTLTNPIPGWLGRVWAAPGAPDPLQTRAQGWEKPPWVCASLSMGAALQQSPGGIHGAAGTGSGGSRPPLPDSFKHPLRVLKYPGRGLKTSFEGVKAKGLPQPFTLSRVINSVIPLGHPQVPDPCPDPQIPCPHPLQQGWSCPKSPIFCPKSPPAGSTLSIPHPLPLQDGQRPGLIN